MGVYAQIKKAEERADVLMDALYKKDRWEGQHNYEIEAFPNTSLYGTA